MGHSHGQVALVALALAACHRDPIGDTWTTADWVQAGVPDPGHAWTADELDVAVKAIQKAVSADRHRLPAFHGNRGGAVFARVVSPAADDPNAELRARFPKLGVALEAHRAFVHLYPVDALEPATREAIEAFGAMFDDYARIEPLADPFMATFGSDDATLPVRQSALDKMQAALAVMIHAALLVGADARAHIADRVALVDYVGRVLPVAFPHFAADAQAQIRSDLNILLHRTTGDLHDAVAADLRLVPP